MSQYEEAYEEYQKMRVERPELFLTSSLYATTSAPRPYDPSIPPSYYDKLGEMIEDTVGEFLISIKRVDRSMFSVIVEDRAIKKKGHYIREGFIINNCHLEIGKVGRIVFGVIPPTDKARFGEYVEFVKNEIRKEEGGSI